MMILVVFFLLSSITASERLKKQYLGPLKNLTDSIFNGYDKHIAPLVVSSKRQGITHDCTIRLNTLHIINLDETNELLTATIDLNQYWEDPRLHWSPFNHSGILEIFVQQQNVWSPPVPFYSTNEIKDHREEGLRTVRVGYNGQHNSRQMIPITSVCKLKMDDFPFDIQECNITVGVSSIPFILYEFEFEILPSVIEDLCLFGNAAWDVIDINVTHLLLPTLDLQEKNAKIILKLKRNPVYYMYMIVLPTSVINTFSFLGVFMKGNGKFEKLEMGISHIMTMMLVLTMIAENLPKTKQVPLLGKYIIFNLCSMIVALMISTNQKNMRNLLSRKYLRINKTFTKRILTICVVALQIANFSSSIYIFYRYLEFEQSEESICKRVQNYTFEPNFDPDE